MALQLLDLFTTTLSGSYTAGGTSLTLSSVSGLPASGDYWIAVYDPSNQTGTYEIFKVTGAASGSTIPVTGAQSGTTNRNHASGETVLGGIWNAASVDQLKTDMLASPAFTGVPTAPTAAPSTNTTQIATTAFVEQELGVSGSGAYFGWGGDGSDGAVTFNGSSTILGMAPSGSVYTMTRDICCTDITVNSGVTIKTANYAIFATGTVQIDGTIHNDGGNASNGGNASSSTGGSAGSAGLRSSNPGGADGHYARLITPVPGTAGGNGGTTTGTQAVAANTGTSSNAATPVDGSGVSGSTGSSGGKGGTGTSGAGGAARTGGAGGTATPAANWQIGRHAAAAVVGTGFVLSGLTATARPFYASNAANGGAPGGSGGGGDTTNAGGGGGGGGGEGGSGGAVSIFAHTISIGASGVVRANGGTGGNGGNGRTQTVGNVGGGGGGAGGSGGVGGIVWLVYHRLTNSGTVQANGGSGGTGGTKGSPHGTGTDDAANGGNGPTGPNGNVIYIPC